MSRLPWIRTLSLLLLFGLGLTIQMPRAGGAMPPAQAQTVVLASPTDLYLPLAQEIAQQEGLPLVHTPAAALAEAPTYLLWVASPTHLSDAVMVEMGRALRGHPTAVAVGLISGSSIEQARALWQRRSQARGRPALVVNAEYPAAGFSQGRVRAQGSEEPLSEASLRQALQSAGYLTFTGHGGSRYWRLDEETRLSSAGIPPLSPIVIGTASCNTFRLWEEGSIALTFADRGAAAYAGFSYSPNEGYLIGEFTGLPFRYTWPEYPIGIVAAVQARGTEQGFAAFPYYWLLGDPRIALQPAMRYRVVSDETRGDTRTLVYTEVPAGAIPILVPEGARYSFVQAAGITAAWSHDPFYNSRLQIADIGEDKYLLVTHSGGDLTLTLRRHPPAGWVPLDIITDALDHTLIYLQQNGGNLIALAMGGLAFAVVLWRLLRNRQKTSWALLPAMAAGFAFAGLHALYTTLRLPHVTITSKPVAASPAGAAATLLLAGCGSFLYLTARSRWEREAAVGLAALPALASALLGLAIHLAGLVIFTPRIGAGPYNPALALLALAALIVECGLYESGFSLLRLLACGLHIHSNRSIGGSDA